MWTKTFALAVLERALKTFAQSAAALLTASGIGLLNADWIQILSVAGMAAVVSLLTSIGTGAATDGSPSVGNVETVAEWPIYEPKRMDDESDVSDHELDEFAADNPPDPAVEGAEGLR